jgi:hypothetical protein
VVGQKVGDPGGRELDRGVNRHSDLHFVATDSGGERFI